MSTTAEQKAWRGNRPASISRAAMPQQGRSAGPSPSASGATTPTSAGPRSVTESKPLAAVTPAEQQSGYKATPAPAPTSNIWEQRKAAAKPPPAPSKDTSQNASNTAAKKEDTQAGKQSAAGQGSGSGNKQAAGALNTSEVADFLGRELASYKTYRIADSGPRPASTSSKSNMANGQSFFATLSKQLSQLSATK